MHDYQRIARVIRYLQARHSQQPSLATLAGVAGLSPHHFHRLFHRWAGVTPKAFLQCLTAAHARERLRAGERVLETALAAGLSGPGRLHDLCVKLEAASPGEVRSGGAGWTIDYGLADSPFGLCLLGVGPRGVCHVSFVEDRKTPVQARLHSQWPGARLQHDDDRAAEIAARFFASSPAAAEGPPLRALVRGTAFQLQVWRALLAVPPGVLVSYGRLAAAVGRPRAARAVGTALGQNPLAYLIPCHRVIRETGVMGIYHWGAERKQAMVAWETVAEAGAETFPPV